MSRSNTPTPGEIRPIYEAESPDELALVDAAYAYNIKLLHRYESINHKIRHTMLIEPSFYTDIVN